MSSTSLQPNSRIVVADCLRGIAVIGIILFHALESFDAYPQSVSLTLPTDEAVYTVTQLLISGKMYGVFALLFGLTFFIMRDNQAKKGRDFSARFAWRMVLLFLIGLFDIAFYDGDILTTYAFCGLLMIPCGYLSNRWLWVLTCFLLIQPFELWQLLSGNEMESEWFWTDYAMLTNHHQHSSFWQNLTPNLQYAFPANIGYFAWTGRLTQIPALFFLGILFGRYRLFYNEGRNLRIWKIIFAVSLPLAVVGSVLDFGPLSRWLTPIVNLAIMMTEIALVVWIWYTSGRIRRLLQPVCSFGQMSLTNYLLQSVLGCFLFYGWGLSLYSQLGFTYALLVGFLLVLLQLLLSSLWMRHHQRGPAENLWRKATWIKY